MADELAATVTLWPNPAPDGVFAVRGAAGLRYAVVDATGRAVAAGTWAEATERLDLQGHAAGLYALRLTWPDGRIATKKLLRP